MPVGALGLLHPGQMGAAVGAAAVTHRTVLWCPAGRGEATRARADAAGLTAVDGLAQLLTHSDVVLSVCPPAFAETLADDIAVAAESISFRGVFVEGNAISVERVERIASRLGPIGVRVVDGAIIGPPPSAERPARLHLAGRRTDVDAVAEIFSDSPVHTTFLSTEIGAASGLKMAFASYQKASRVLAAIAHALAQRHGVSDELLAEARRMPSNILTDVDYVPGVAARAWRWHGELHEIADTLAAAGLPTELATGAAEALQRWEADRDNWDLTTEQTLARLFRPPS